MYFDVLIVFFFKFVQLFLHEIIVNSSLMAGTVNDFKISPVNAVVKIEILTSGNLGKKQPSSS